MAVCRGPWKQVENVIMAEMDDAAPFNCVLLPVPEGERCCPGMVWLEGHFSWPAGMNDPYGD